MLKYIYMLYKKYFKWYFFQYRFKKYRSFLQYSRFYKIIYKRIKKKKKKLKKRSRKFLYPSLKRIYNLGYFGEIKYTGIFQFSIRSCLKNTGFPYWFKFLYRWLHNSLLKFKTLRFFFSPLRIKVLLKTKKYKFLIFFKRLVLFHPKVGKNTTIGLVGNGLARNTFFLKKKIFTKIFLLIYYMQNHYRFLFLWKKFHGIYSNFIDLFSKTLNFFETRLDIILFRAGFVINNLLCRLLISRGYLSVNFIQIRNFYYRVQLFKFVSFTWRWRNIFFDLFQEGLITLKSSYLLRYSKIPFIRIISHYIKFILSSIFQMQERSYWLKKLSTIYTIFNEFQFWIPTILHRSINEMQINRLINPFYKFDKRVKNIGSNSNTLKFRKQVNNFPYLCVKNFSKFFFLKKFYSKILFNVTFFILNIKQKKSNLNMSLKLIIKDLLIQSWEFFPNYLFINIRYRYLYYFSFFLFKNINFLHANFSTLLTYSNLKIFIQI